jgi:hypothetical protein
MGRYWRASSASEEEGEYLDKDKIEFQVPSAFMRCLQRELQSYCPIIEVELDDR